jgi:hypothetical protein
VVEHVEYGVGLAHTKEDYDEHIRTSHARLFTAEPIGDEHFTFSVTRCGGDRDKEDVLSEQDLKQLRENLSRLSPQGVRDFYDRAHEECRLIYTRLPTPRKIQTLVQVWKQLWKWK